MAEHADDDFAAMFAASEQGAPRTKRPRVGDQVKGKIISVGKDAVFIDAGGKAEGVLGRDQVTNKDGELTVKVGDVVEARVVSDQGGVLQLRMRMGGRGPEQKAELQQAFELGMPVEGTVTELVKGGVSVDVAGVRGFCPASQIDARFVEDLTPFVGQKLQFRITKYEARNLVLSRRALVEEEKEKIATETRKKLEPGLVMRGKVVGFKPFGAFIDIGGMEGMLHISELGYNRVEKPEDVLTLGQEVDVVVLKIEQGVDKQNRPQDRISLSLKALANDPWNEITAHLREGSKVKGKITRLQPFGAFVEIAPSVEGLVHISALGAGRRIEHPKEVVSPGQEVEATVISVDPERRRISLMLGESEGGSAEDLAAYAASQTPRASQQPGGAAEGGGGRLGTFADLLGKLKK